MSKRQLSSAAMCIVIFFTSLLRLEPASCIRSMYECQHLWRKSENASTPTGLPDSWVALVAPESFLLPGQASKRKFWWKDNLWFVGQEWNEENWHERSLHNRGQRIFRVVINHSAFQKLIESIGNLFLTMVRVFTQRCWVQLWRIEESKEDLKNWDSDAQHRSCWQCLVDLLHIS